MDIQRKLKSRRRPFLIPALLIGGLVLVTAALSQLEPASPSVKRSMLSFDTVKRGLLVRDVRGPGNLVPEQIRYITALTPGRVERVFVRPGVTVDSSTVLMELSNPDVHIQALQAEQQLTGAEAALVSLKLNLESDRLTQEAAVAAAQSEYDEATRQAKTNEELAKEGLVAGQVLARSQDRMRELATRLDVEKKRLDLTTRSTSGQLAVHQQQVDRLRAISRFQEEQVGSMQVKAGAKGVLQELSLEVGQWVTPGMTLAVVAEPGRLKAVLRVSETEARDIVLRQPARIDTRNGVVDGKVLRVDPVVQNGSVTVEVSLEGALPLGLRPDMSVDGTIEIDRRKDVLYVDRPVNGSTSGAASVFRVEANHRSATRVPVRFGVGSVSAIEILDGLKEGDEIVLSDMSSWDGHDRVRIR